MQLNKAAIDKTNDKKSSKYIAIAVINLVALTVQTADALCFKYP